VLIVEMMGEVEFGQDRLLMHLQLFGPGFPVGTDADRQTARVPATGGASCRRQLSSPPGNKDGWCDTPFSASATGSYLRLVITSQRPRGHAP
jgi:hypothetical protein